MQPNIFNTTVSKLSFYYDNNMEHSNDVWRTHLIWRVSLFVGSYESVLQEGKWLWADSFTSLSTLKSNLQTYDAFSINV